MSARFPRDPKRLRSDCVSGPVHEDSRRFLNENSHFPADYVSRHLETKSGHRRGRLDPRRPFVGLTPQPLPKPLVSLLVALSLVPRLARSPMSLALTLGCAAHQLPITRSSMREKPPSADPARALAGHPPPASPASPPASPLSPSARPPPFGRHRVHLGQHGLHRPSSRRALGGSVLASETGFILTGGEELVGIMRGGSCFGYQARLESTLG